MIPPAVLATFCLSLLFLVLGWALSASLGLKLEKSRHSKLRLFLILPPTSPIASAILLFRRPLLGLPGLLCYLLAVASLPLGGSMALSLEEERRDAFSLLSAGSVPTSPEIQSESGPVPDSSKQWKHPLLAAVLENAFQFTLLTSHPLEGWSHPLLAPMLENQNLDPGGVGVLQLVEAAKDAVYQEQNLDPHFFGTKALPSTYPSQYSFELEESSPESHPSATSHGGTLEEEAENDGSLQELLAMATALQIDSGEPERPFQDWEDVSVPLMAFLEGSEPSLLALEEALGRDHVAFPSKGLVEDNTLMNLLQQLRELTIALQFRSQAHVLAGNEEEAFRHIRLAFLAAHATDHDLLISRLVQLGQFHIALETVRFALQFRIGSEQDWRGVMEQLDSVDLLPMWSDALRREPGASDSFAMAWVPIPPGNSAKPLQKRSELPLHLQAWDFLAGDCLRAIQLGLQNRAGEPSIGGWLLRKRENKIFAYWIREGERFAEESKSVPWDDCMPRLDRLAKNAAERNVDPSIFSALHKFLNLQLRVEMAKVEVALELHRLARGSYPEKLEQLAPEFVAEPPSNPKTGQPWNYQRKGDSGYSLLD